MFSLRDHGKGYYSPWKDMNQGQLGSMHPACFSQYFFLALGSIKDQFLFFPKMCHITHTLILTFQSAHIQIDNARINLHSPSLKQELTFTPQPQPHSNKKDILVFGCLSALLSCVLHIICTCSIICLLFKRIVCFWTKSNLVLWCYFKYDERAMTATLRGGIK